MIEVVQEIKEAAEIRHAGDSGGAWRLADALAEELPDRGHGGRPRHDAETSGDVPTSLREIAARLSGHLATPNPT